MKQNPGFNDSLNSIAPGESSALSRRAHLLVALCLDHLRTHRDEKHRGQHSCEATRISKRTQARACKSGRPCPASSVCHEASAVYSQISGRGLYTSRRWLRHVLGHLDGQLPRQRDRRVEQHASDAQGHVLVHCVACVACVSCRVCRLWHVSVCDT